MHGKGKRGRDQQQDDRGGRGGRGRGGIVRTEYMGGQPKRAKPVIRDVDIQMPVTVKQLCADFGQRSNNIISALFEEGIMKRINDYLTQDEVETLALKFDINVTIKEEKSIEEQAEELLEQSFGPSAVGAGDVAGDMQPRPPVVTMLGHVDHGKTSLLDRIRESDVASREDGGITQHIGASLVTTPDGRKVTFLDTPGHEAFTEMRARGAKVTDMVVLVVAADDGVMPTTREAIDHAKAAEVPIIVALNKMDRDEANPNRVKGQLAEAGLTPTGDWGGDTELVECAAHPKSSFGIDDLLETILLQADVMELQANPNKPARGTVLEGKKDPSQGVNVSILIQEGTLHLNDLIVAGVGSGRVRAMTNDKGEHLESAGPGEPVRVLGFDHVPTPGDKVYVTQDLKAVRTVTETRAIKMRETEWIKRQAQNQDILAAITESKVSEVYLVIKADTQGSCEVLGDVLTKLSTDEVRVKILRSAVGGITETDVTLARTATPSMVIGFHVIADEQAEHAAEEHDVPVRTFRVIYELTDAVKMMMQGQLAPEQVEVSLGRAEVRKLFPLKRVGMIAGCYVTQGTIKRDARLRVYRNKKEISPEAGYELASLRRHTDDVKEVQQGYECGLVIAGFSDVKEGDVLQFFEVEEKARTLD
jgi:translation initiation factor IF-2